MKITFGKHSGQDTRDLARTTDGRSYLSWGAENLKSPVWRKEFSDALKAVSAADLDVNLEADAIMQSDAQIDPNDAYMLAQEIKADLIADEARDKAMEEAKDHFFASLRQAGISEQGAKVVFGIICFGDIDQLAEAEKHGRIKFSSPEKRAEVWRAAIEFDGMMESIL